MDQGKIAITHASEHLGEAILEKLTESGLESDSVVLLDDESKVGVKLALGSNYLTIEDQQSFDYSVCSLVLMTQFDEQIAQKLENQNALVLSHVHSNGGNSIYAPNSDTELDISYTQQQVQLVGAELACLLGVLPALQAYAPIKTINTVFLRSADASGKQGIDELAGQTVELLNGRDVTPAVYPLQIAFNMLPAAAITALNDDLPRLLGDEKIESVHQIIDVPVFHGLGIAVQLSFDSEIDVKQCEKILKKLDNVFFKTTIASPITDCNQSFSATVAGVEQVANLPNTLQLWLIADPLRYGLASNYVNVVDILLKSFL
ncbi:MAG: aspartate-semialdehyde dehydrogenase [Gammaproteobacteria bacterium]|jgi:aspartate-semialdehyde dehydrogenase